jgi:hypothetical protein
MGSELEQEFAVWQDCRVAPPGSSLMNVIPFPRRPRPRFYRPVDPPSALGGDLMHAGHASSEEDFEDRRRMRQNLATLALVVVLVVAGAWLIERLRIYSRNLACIESGHRSCAVVDPRHLPSR